ncbi:MAG: hypothetical protein C0602_07355 [Denitrovibrio sp.]|nr:MAG: hypothetical protein C0602_07355 [Denitrovibrio sp.]
MKIKTALLIMIMTVFTGNVMAESLANLQAIAQELERRKIDLDKREKVISSKEERLKALEDELLQKESELRKLKETISTRLNEIKTQEDENLDALAKAYGSAKAKSSADIIAKMDIAKAVQLFLRMNSMTAGKIISAMGKSDPVFAARISERLTPESIQGIDEN